MQQALQAVDRREAPQQVTDDYEDRGLFRTPPVWLFLYFTPQIGRNQRGDTTIRAYVEQGVEIEALFAGRRKGISEPLVANLKKRWTAANRAATGEPPSPENVRVKIRVCGSWRARFEHDAEGWMSKSYQFVVAQWVGTDSQGNDIIFGTDPKEGPSEPAPDVPFRSNLQR